MNKNNLETLFNRLENELDVEVPNINHSQRFLNKLNKRGELQLVKAPKQRRRLWKPLIGVAASIALLIALFIGGSQESNARDLANVSPKMAETQDFFTATINEELNEIQKESSPEVQSIIKDALLRIKALEGNYETLKTDLIESGDDNRVIYAMISNFQNRIDILQNTLQQIKNIKELKNITDENSITI